MGNKHPKYTNVPDPVTELTDKERDLILKSWEPLACKENIKLYSVEFFKQFFRTYPEVLDYFPFYKQMSDEELKNSKKLAAHGTAVFSAINTYVMMIDDPDTLVGLVFKLAQTHVPRNIHGPEFEKLMNAFIPFIKGKVGSNFTPECETAWQKFFAIHTVAYSMGEQEMEQD